MKTPRIGLYPGTFDPPTNGHLDIILRAAKVVDELIVGVAVNAGKGPMFDIDDRVAMVRDEVAAQESADLAARIRVQTMDGLLVHYALANGVDVIVRGLRAVSDFEFEFQLANMNRHLNARVETVFLTPTETFSYISSSLVREIATLGGDVGGFVHPRVETELLQRCGREPEAGKPS